MGFGRIARHVIWGCLALALLLAPLLGLMHGVVHGVAGPFHATSVHAHEAQGHTHDHADEHTAAAGWLADLFSVHADDSDCRVYDQLCHSDVFVSSPALVLPLVLSSFLFHFIEGEFLARRAALFEARGPPLTR